MAGTIWKTADRERLWDLGETQGLSVEAILAGGHFGTRPKMAIAKLLSRMRKERGAPKNKVEKRFKAPQLVKFKQFLLEHPTEQTPIELVAMWNKMVETELLYKGYPKISHGTLIKYQADYGVRLKRSAVYEMGRTRGDHAAGNKERTAKFKKKINQNLVETRAALLLANEAAVKKLTEGKRSFEIFPCPHCRHPWMLESPYYPEVRGSLVTTVCSPCRRELGLTGSVDNDEAKLRRQIISVYQHYLLQLAVLSALQAGKTTSRTESRACEVCGHSWLLERTFWPTSTSSAGNACYGRVCKSCACLRRSLRRRSEWDYDLEAFIKAFPAANLVLAGAALPSLSDFKKPVSDGEAAAVGESLNLVNQTASIAAPVDLKVAPVAASRAEPKAVTPPVQVANAAAVLRPEAVEAKPPAAPQFVAPARVRDELADFIPEKVCRGCMETKPLTPEFWDITAVGEIPTGGGVYTYCRTCISKVQIKTKKRK